MGRVGRSFFEIYSGLIYNVARRAGLADADAKDIVQETTIKVCQGIDRFENRHERGAFKAWLATVTRSRINNFFAAKQGAAAAGAVAGGGGSGGAGAGPKGAVSGDGVGGGVADQPGAGGAGAVEEAGESATVPDFPRVRDRGLGGGGGDAGAGGEPRAGVSGQAPGGGGVSGGAGGIKGRNFVRRPKNQVSEFSLMFFIFTTAHRDIPVPIRA